MQKSFIQKWAEGPTDHGYRQPNQQGVGRNPETKNKPGCGEATWQDTKMILRGGQGSGHMYSGGQDTGVAVW